VVYDEGAHNKEQDGGVQFAHFAVMLDEVAKLWARLYPAFQHKDGNTNR
jgi:hypothetical protein